MHNSYVIRPGPSTHATYLETKNHPKTEDDLTYLETKNHPKTEDDLTYLETKNHQKTEDDLTYLEIEEVPQPVHVEGDELHVHGEVGDGQGKNRCDVIYLETKNYLKTEDDLTYLEPVQVERDEQHAHGVVGDGQGKNTCDIPGD